MRHAADSDHVVALSTLVARQKKLAATWLLGAFWGLGHTSTIFLAGSAIILFKINISPRLESILELLVGIVLIILGLLNMAGHGLGVGEHSHPHIHVTEPGWIKNSWRNAGPLHILRAAIAGIIHGLAGSAAVALLVLAAIPNPKIAVFYLLIFGFSTVAGMLILSAFMGLFMLYLARRWKKTERTLSFGTGLLSIFLGFYIAAQNSKIIIKQDATGHMTTKYFQKSSVPEGGSPQENNSMLFFTKVPEISVEDLKAKLDHKEKFIFLDVREQSEYDIAKIPGTQLVPLKSLPEHIKNLDKSQEVIVHCKSGGRSGKAVKMLIDQGFKAFNVVGGIDTWSRRIDPSVPTY